MLQLLAVGVVAAGLGRFWTAVAFPPFGLSASDRSGTSLADPELTVTAGMERKEKLRKTWMGNKSIGLNG